MVGIIQIQNVTKKYSEGIVALDDVSLSIDQDEFIFLSGPSGAGKSTLLRLISALEQPTSGRIFINDQDISNLSRSAIPFLRRRFGLITQQQSLLLDRSILENVMLPMLVVGTEKEEAVVRAQAALEMVGLLHRAKAMPRAISGGEQQRVHIARAIVNRPQMILADEPTANLDWESANLVLDILSVFKKAGITCLVSTHDDKFLNRATRVIYLREGKLVNDRRVMPTARYSE